MARLSLLSWVLTLASCLTSGAAPVSPAGAERKPEPVTPKPEPAQALVLITIDGVRARDVFQGAERELMRARRLAPSYDALLSVERVAPTLQRMITGGAALGAPGVGEPPRVSGRNHVSLPGYLEIFGGAAHACTSNDCAFEPRKTLLDDLREARALAPEQVVALSSWRPIGRAVSASPERMVVSAGREQGSHLELLERACGGELAGGRVADAMPGFDDYRPDAHTAALALCVADELAPPVLYVGLGDTDEWAHRGDYGRYLDALREADALVGELRQRAAASGRSTTFLVTTDHGRERGFDNHGEEAESADIWIVAEGPGVAKRGLVGASTSWPAASIAPTVRSLAGLEPRGAPIVDLLGSP
jgi:hypothetical protein